MPELAVTNPTDANVLLYDGEELLGAKQNRILNVTVLVAARSTTRIPVSCVEQGRWSRRSAGFSSAPHASHAHLRRRKAQMLAAEPLVPGIAQSEVWDEVAAKSARLDVHSPTGAQADVFRSRADELHELEGAFPLQPGQCGALLALGDDLCLDYVSRPEAFARLYPKLRAGYLLDGLERLDSPPTAHTAPRGVRRVDRRRNRRPPALRRPRRGRAPARRRRPRLGARARRRAASTLRVHERRAKRADREAEPTHVRGTVLADAHLRPPVSGG